MSIHQEAADKRSNRTRTGVSKSIPNSIEPAAPQPKTVPLARPGHNTTFARSSAKICFFCLFSQKLGVDFVGSCFFFFIYNKRLGRVHEGFLSCRIQGPLYVVLEKVSCLRTFNSLLLLFCCCCVRPKKELPTTNLVERQNLKMNLVDNFLKHINFLNESSAFPRALSI